MGSAPTGTLLQGNLRIADIREGPRYDGGLWPGRAATGRISQRTAANPSSPVVFGTIWGISELSEETTEQVVFLRNPPKKMSRKVKPEGNKCGLAES